MSSLLCCGAVLFFAVGIVGYCRLVMLRRRGLLPFQKRNVQRNRPGKVATYAKTKVSQKKQKHKKFSRFFECGFWIQIVKS
jgi:hypothetical protein